jgi:hypothetical protein
VSAEEVPVSHQLMYVGGQWVDAAAGGVLEAIDPTSN